MKENFNIQEELKKMPEKPGIYIMKDKNKKIIYIGKAINLKNRVRQYFQSLTGQLPKVRLMVSKIKEFEYIVTDTEMEALILECNLIKKHKPNFNILLKDDKNYPYIKVTMGEEYPRVLITRKIEKDGAKYFGPYSNVGAVRETLFLLKKLFPFKKCNKVLPRDIGKERPCLNYHIKQCLGPCKGDVNREDYRAIMKDICSFLDGRQSEVMERFEREMKQAAENMEFENAAIIRDKINSLKHILEKQKMISTDLEDQDIIAFARNLNTACIQVFFVREGKLVGRDHFIFREVEEENTELISSFIKQFYSSAVFIPKEILVQEKIDEANLIESWLGGEKGSRVYLKTPKKGEKLKLIEMVEKNAIIELDNFMQKTELQEKFSKEGIESLKKLLGLNKDPDRIEAFDISNTGKSEMVASMIVFEKGVPAKKEYRRFKIRYTEGINDYGAMQEVVYRRFNNIKFDKLPDVILVDGGIGHVSSVGQVLSKLKIDIPVAGMVKDQRHRTRGLVFQGKEIDLLGNISQLRFISSIQDEAHRFALDYNKKLRAKRYKVSVLDEIDGIGEVRKKELLRHFKSINNIKEAEFEELMAVKGINKSAALNVYQFFNKTNNKTQ